MPPSSTRCAICTILTRVSCEAAAQVLKPLAASSVCVTLLRQTALVIPSKELERKNFTDHVQAAHFMPSPPCRQLSAAAVQAALQLGLGNSVEDSTPGVDMVSSMQFRLSVQAAQALHGLASGSGRPRTARSIN